MSFCEYLKLKETGTTTANVAIVPSKIPFGMVTRQFPDMGLGDAGSFAFPSNKKKKKKKSKKKINEVHSDSGLGKWLKEKWVDISRKDKSGKHPPCGASAEKEGRDKDQKKAYPKCRPAKEAASMSKKEKKKAVSQKRRAEKKSGHHKGRKPVVVSHYKEDIDAPVNKPIPAMVVKAEEPILKNIVEVVFDREPINVKGDFALNGTITIFTKQGLNRTQIYRELVAALDQRIHLVKISDDFEKAKEVHVFDKLKNKLIKNAYIENLKDCKVMMLNKIMSVNQIKESKELIDLINNFDKLKNKNGIIEIKFKLIIPAFMV